MILDVVIRTLANSERGDLLFRALDSIQNQYGINARPIIVVNGQNHNSDVLERLEKHPGILIHHVVEASATIALVEGRRLVTAPYFAYLDDDDELIQDSLHAPMEWLESNADCDVLITNGCSVSTEGAKSELNRIADHLRIGNPLLSLLEDSWLQPGAFVCRSRSISAHALTTSLSCMEWTQIAYQICLANKRINFLDVPTVRHYDTPGSLSKKPAYVEASLALMRMMRSDVRLDGKVRKRADRKYHDMLHTLAMENWRSGDMGLAWRFHLASMRHPYTFKYLLCSRYLLRRAPHHRKNPAGS